MDSLENLIPTPVTDAGVLSVPPPRPIKIVRDGILAFVSSISVTIGLVVVVVIAALILGTMKIESSQNFKFSPGLMVVMLFAAELPFAAVALFLRWRYRSTGRTIPRLFEGPLASAILTGIPAGLAMAIIGFLNAILSTWLFGQAASDSLKEVMEMLSALRGNPGVVVALVFSIGVLAPCCEEAFFRGAIFNSVRSTSKARAAAILSSILFAIAHLNLRMFPYYFVFGLTMCWLISKRRSIAAPIAAHMTVNLLACLAILISPPAT